MTSRLNTKSVFLVVLLLSFQPLCVFSESEAAEATEVRSLREKGNGRLPSSHTGSIIKFAQEIESTNQLIPSMLELNPDISREEMLRGELLSMHHLVILSELMMRETHDELVGGDSNALPPLESLYIRALYGPEGFKEKLNLLEEAVIEHKDAPAHIMALCHSEIAHFQLFRGEKELGFRSVDRALLAVEETLEGPRRHVAPQILARVRFILEDTDSWTDFLDEYEPPTELLEKFSRFREEITRSKWNENEFVNALFISEGLLVAQRATPAARE